jgi:hypothetical protein
MNWDKTSAISEILASIAILVTLVYLAVEINQNAEATRAEVRQAMLASDQQLLEQLMDDPQLSLSWYKEELDDEERVRLGYFLVTHLRMRENNWLQYKNGILDEETWRSFRLSLGVIFSARQPRRWWLNRGVEQLFNSEFVADVNALIGDLPVVESSPQLGAFD